MDQLDINGLFQDLLARPGDYGLTDTTNPAILGLIGAPGTAVSDPDSHLFWDDIHPTASVHALIGRAGLGAIGVPEPSSLILVGLGIAGCSLIAARRRH